MYDILNAGINGTGEDVYFELFFPSHMREVNKK